MAKKPPQVEDAIARGDQSALRAMAKAGGCATARKIKLKRALGVYFRELDQELRNGDEYTRMRQANEDICPIDQPED